MAKQKVRFICGECDYSTVKWMGKCPECRAWNSFTEHQPPPQVGGQAPPALDTIGAPVPLSSIDLSHGGELRIKTGIDELDVVLGGGLVAGSLTLIGGDPGVGKSTLLLMALDRFARRGLPVLYVTGEESARQLRMRAQRLGVVGDNLLVMAHTDFAAIEAAARKAKPIVVVIDSVQTVQLAHVSGIPGSVSQVRAVAHQAMIFAKGTSTATMLVGHVTKDGGLAGPKVLEHLVDTVLYFEGDGRSSLRVLRAVKNRFGAAGEMGLFEMGDVGLVEVPDASARLLAERAIGAPGTSVVATLEGTRPLLAEVQALVGPAGTHTPARTCVGVDRTRVLMLAAVLQKAGVDMHDRDIFVNATGGVRLYEPAADLAIIAALASSLTDLPVRSDTLVLGEVGLVGEVRAVSHPALRLKEAARHGFRRIIAPPSTVEHAPPGVEVRAVRSVRDALAAIA